MIATVLLPVPLIVLLRLVILLGVSWVYFFLYAFVLAYGVLLMLSWSVYLAIHYDIQEAKRLVPFISSGTCWGPLWVAWWWWSSVRLLGPANMLLLWVATLGAGALLVRHIARRYPFLEAPKVKRGGASQAWCGPLLRDFVYVRTSALFMTMALTTFTTMIALQLMDFEYSTIFRATFPERGCLDRIPRHVRWADDGDRPLAAMVRRALESAPFRCAGHQPGVSVCLVSGFRRPGQHVSAALHHLAGRHVCPLYADEFAPDPARHTVRPHVKCGTAQDRGAGAEFQLRPWCCPSVRVSAPCCCCS